ncbi:hypothetical protein M6D81_13930 [Paenibacillus sp. J5C_2022]|uniref:hypothetical protein n=1 Tax=Paenibacillus sp. J5C2022 TaxID=2977129 RepID=UPI0021CE3D0C|nr:hypothetical protein [Paenibacillus sp. J5C2022]MCU6709792.1 hypothetical protein [Paenibacillus sp. J5C2022]
MKPKNSTEYAKQEMARLSETYQIPADMLPIIRFAVQNAYYDGYQNGQKSAYDFMKTITER